MTIIIDNEYLIEMNHDNPADNPTGNFLHTIRWNSRDHGEINPASKVSSKNPMPSHFVDSDRG